MVEAVTLTTIIVALVRICCKVSLFLHFSRLFPNSYGGKTNREFDAQTTSQNIPIKQDRIILHWCVHFWWCGNWKLLYFGFKSYHLSFTASLITKTQPAFLWQSVVIIWSHRYFNFCVYNSKFVIHYWPTMVSHFITRFFFVLFKKADKHFNSSHLDCANVIKRIWHQRLELWEPLGVLVPRKLVNDIWNPGRKSQQKSVRESRNP